MGSRKIPDMLLVVQSSNVANALHRCLPDSRNVIPPIPDRKATVQSRAEIQKVVVVIKRTRIEVM